MDKNTTSSEDSTRLSRRQFQEATTALSNKLVNQIALFRHIDKTAEKQSKVIICASSPHSPEFNVGSTFAPEQCRFKWQTPEAFKYPKMLTELPEIKEVSHIK